jgi:hypothetical protein
MLRTMKRTEVTAIAEAIQSLVSHEQVNGETYITLPLLYPSGTSVVVRVRVDGDSYFVSDMGMGWSEVEMMGGSQHLYNGIGKKIADASGVGFDTHAFFVLQIRNEQLVGAVITIGNCSLEAAMQSAFSIAERREREENDRLYARLVTLYRPRHIDVAKEVIIRGASDHEWRASILATRDVLHRTMFEAVSNHGNSISAVATKFLDIGRSVSAPDRIAVVKSKRELGNFLGIIAPVSTRVIEAHANDDELLSLAAA